MCELVLLAVTLVGGEPVVSATVAVLREGNCVTLEEAKVRVWLNTNGKIDGLIADVRPKVAS